jgi:hypothetical protein
LVTFALLGNKGNIVNIGCGNASGEPAQDFFWWLREIGWHGSLLLDINPDYIREARAFHPEATCVCTDALQVDYKMLFDYYKVPKIIDVLSFDIDPVTITAFKKFPFDEYEFKLGFVETDFYNPWGKQQKAELDEFMKDKTDYKLFAEHVGLVHCTPNWLEDWFVNVKYLDDFEIDIKDVFYEKCNPNDIVVDLFRRKFTNPKHNQYL